MKHVLILLIGIAAIAMFSGCDSSSDDSGSNGGGGYILEGYFSELEGSYTTISDTLTTGGNLLVRDYGDLTAEKVEAYRQALALNDFSPSMGGIAYASRLDEDGTFYSWNAMREKTDGTTRSQWAKTSATPFSGWATSLFGTPPAGCTLMGEGTDPYARPHLCAGVASTDIESYIKTLKAADIDCEEIRPTPNTTQSNYYCEVKSGDFIYSAIARGNSSGSGYTILMFAEGGGDGTGGLATGSADEVILENYFSGIAGTYIKLTPNDTISGENKSVARKYLSFEGSTALEDYGAALTGYSNNRVSFYYKTEGDIRYSWNALDERDGAATLRWTKLDKSTLASTWKNDSFAASPTGGSPMGGDFGGILAYLYSGLNGEGNTAYKGTLASQGFSCVELPATVLGAGGLSPNPNYLCTKASGSNYYTWFGRANSSGNGYTYMYFVE